ncbi:hypothetical protein JT739_04520 [Tepidanaerobacter sp. GT38]|uniref:hypothetical protein n=1 Tax=Tepidanaerobacter sp. GT38 TaxID=2722793 RepID=UPI001F21A036|nr:hypothetical protein [Tepidanaerobacter sp. GT38]MCG1011863.1 hypothetical protein [Tepidanaerobacter sp. GT38]
MAKKKRQKEARNKLVPPNLKEKGNLVDDTSPEYYELSEEIAQGNSQKTPENKKKQKKNK